MLDWLAYMIETQLNDDPSDYFGYAMGYFSLLLLAPIMYSFAKDIFEHSKAPRNIFFITMFFIMGVGSHSVGIHRILLKK